MILSIYYQRHDGAVTVMDKGEILYYSQEENFTTIKHDTTVWCSLIEVANKFDHFDVVFVHTLGAENDITEQTLEAMLQVLDFTYDNIVVDKVNHHKTVVHDDACQRDNPEHRENREVHAHDQVTPSGTYDAEGDGAHDY